MWAALNSSAAPSSDGFPRRVRRSIFLDAYHLSTESRGNQDRYQRLEAPLSDSENEDGRTPGLGLPCQHGSFNWISCIAKCDPTFKWPEDKSKKEINKHPASWNWTHRETGKKNTLRQCTFPSLPSTANHQHSTPAHCWLLLKMRAAQLSPLRSRSSWRVIEMALSLLPEAQMQSLVWLTRVSLYP